MALDPKIKKSMEAPNHRQCKALGEMDLAFGNLTTTLLQIDGGHAMRSVVAALNNEMAVARRLVLVKE